MNVKFALLIVTVLHCFQYLWDVPSLITQYHGIWVYHFCLLEQRHLASRISRSQNSCGIPPVIFKSKDLDEL